MSTKNDRSQKSNVSRSKDLVVGTAIAVAAITCTTLFGSMPARAQQQQQQRPNILVIFGDDVGQSNISAYSHGLVG
jgi:glycosylphosphatidylinositol transamidase (GPIT) subunit GPI8